MGRLARRLLWSGRTAPAAGCLALALSGAGCGGGPSGAGRGSSSYEGVLIGDAGSTRTPARDDEWGEWERLASAPGPAAGRPDGPPPEPASAGRSAVWTIVLETFTGERPDEAAATMLKDLPAIDPGLGAAWVHTGSAGSTVVFGRYEGPESPQARRDLEWVKGIASRGRPVFPRAMLSRVHVGSPGSLGPYELMSVRLRHPKVDPLYTLEVAVWGDFGGRLGLEEIHRSAEAYARQLRAEGHEAYYHHDDEKRLSIVTVGLFDRTAIDQRSGLYSSQVQALFARFPAHLVNGEPLQELKDRTRPHLGTQVQTPRLVHVPKL